MLLLPFVEFDEHTDEPIGTYTALYSYEPGVISSIEPTKEGNTMIRNKIGGNFTFAVPIETFLAYVTKLDRVDLFFLEDVKKNDPHIMSVFNKLGIILETK